MTNQEKKKHLQRYTELNKAINQKLDELSRQKSLCEKITTTYSDMPKGGSSERDDRYIKLIMLDDQINADIDKYVDMRKEIHRVIDTMPDMTLKTLLLYRYIDGDSWEQIAVKMNYTYRHITRMHGVALNRLKL